MCSYIAFHWLISNADVKNEWSYTPYSSSPLYRHGVYTEKYMACYICLKWWHKLDEAEAFLAYIRVGILRLSRHTGVIPWWPLPLPFTALAI